MGGDFQYQAAEINYLNIDKLIGAFQKYSDKYNVFYSTPSCYVDAVKATNPLTVKDTGDFFPYNENAHVYWAGYYTSKLNLKRYERMGNNILQPAQNLNAFAKLKKICDGSECEENIRTLREAIGTMQHHDAITGTEKERVAYDYSRMLTKAIRDSEKSIGKIIGNLLKFENVTEDVTLPLSTCLLTNISVCDQTLKDRSVFVIYNPLSKYVVYHIRLPVKDGTYKLTGPYGNINFELIKHIKYPLKYPFDTSDTELVAKDNIPPMGMKMYYLQKISDTPSAIEPRTLKENETVTFDNNGTKVTFDPKTRQYTFIKNEKEDQFVQEFLYYISNNGTGTTPGSGDNITSGAYVFRPMNGTEAQKIDETDYRVQVVNGTDTTEIYEYFGDYIRQATRFFTDNDVYYIEFDWVVGPLNNKTVLVFFYCYPKPIIPIG